MAIAISIDVYEFSTGNEFSRKYTQGIISEQIVSTDPASVYNFKNQYFTGVRSKITQNQAGVLKVYYVAQTVDQIKTLITA
jgi:hypothetical protein